MKGIKLKKKKKERKKEKDWLLRTGKLVYWGEQRSAEKVAGFITVWTKIPAVKCCHFSRALGDNTKRRAVFGKNYKSVEIIFGAFRTLVSFQKKKNLNTSNSSIKEKKIKTEFFVKILSLKN